MIRRFENRSIGFKVMLFVLALVLIISVSVAGTLAWLTAQSDTVTNTFTSAELFEKPSSDFTLWEHRVADVDGDGKYEWAKTDGDDTTATEQNDADKVTANSYDILPGVDIPKDPTVTVSNLEEYAYLFVKVSGTLPDGLSYSIDDNWTALNGFNGVYVYSGSPAEDKVIKATDADKKTFTATILENNKIVVADDYTGTADEITLNFIAYMVQANGNGTSAENAWANTYGKTIS